MANITSVFIFFFCLFTLSSNIAQNADIEEEVQSVIQKYLEVPSLKLDFQFQLRNAEEPPQIFHGTFFKYRDIYKVDLDNYTIYSNGKSQYTVQKKNKEVQITTLDPESVELSSPAGILKYLANQRFKYFDKSALYQGGHTLRIVEMVPTDKNSEYFKIRFSYVMPEKQLKSVEIFARDGQRIQLTIGETSFSGNFSQKSIEWNPDQYKDYYIEDLRID